MAKKITTKTTKITHEDSTHGESANLKTAVHEAVEGADTGDTLTVQESTISVDLPTGARSHPPE